MNADPVPTTDTITTVDVPMFGMSQVNSPYIIDAPAPAIVDTGPEAGGAAVLDALEACGIAPDEVEYIFPTHAHLDHAGGAGYLVAACEAATVVCHEKGIEYLTNDKKLEQLTDAVEKAIGVPEPYGNPKVIDRERCEAVSGGETFDLGDRSLEVIDAPGHAPHQYCLYDTTSEMLFTADANGMQFPDVGHRPTTPPSNFDLEQTLDTVERLLKFDPNTLLYAHYGPGTPGAGVEELRAYQNMLPAYVERVASLQAEYGADVSAIAKEMRAKWGHWSLETDIAGILQYIE